MYEWVALPRRGGLPLALIRAGERQAVVSTGCNWFDCAVSTATGRACVQVLLTAIQP
jgi:hypothetical protein